MWSVRVLSGQQAGQVFDLKLGKNIFGRGGSSQFKVQSLGISKEHCEVHVYKDKLMIVDLKSSNGTFVNGIKIQNSLIRMGDKISLFDIIMDIIPTPDIRPKNHSNSLKSPTVLLAQSGPSQNQIVTANQPHYPQAYPQQGNHAYQMSPQMQNYSQPEFETNGSPISNENLKPAEPTLSEKAEFFIENVMMPSIYKLAIIFSFRQVLMSFVVLFIFGVTILSMYPLTTIVKESNMIEAKKRARSVARALAKFNEQALLSGQLTNLSVQEALKEDGVKEAFIIQQSDGAIVAPSEKAGRETTSSFIIKARNESRAVVDVLGSSLIGASHPIGVYDPNSGEPSVKYHAIVMYDVSTLSLDQDRVISLFMQTLTIASALGLILFFLFWRMIEFPVKNLNQQIDKALLEKSDRTEVPFDDPSFQKLVSNVNTLLNRVWTQSSGSEGSSALQQNKDIEFSHLVEMMTHPAIVIDTTNRVVALNTNFAQLAQIQLDSILNQSYQNLTDNALVQNIEALLIRSRQSPYDKHTDRIPFSQFECEIYCQAFLNNQNEAEYFVMTLIKVEAL